MTLDSKRDFAGFPSTAWSCIDAAKDHTRPEHAAAVNRLITLYWRPVFYYMRARGVPLAEAQDLTQEFFMDLLERDKIAKVDREKGRFRNFLRTVVRRFLSDRVGKKAKRQTRFERTFVSIQTLMGDEERNYEPAGGETAEEVFDRQWARASCHTVVDQLREHYAAEGREEWVDLFMAYRAPEEKRPSQQSLAERFGLSRDEVRAILEKVEKRYVRLLRAELREEGVGEQDLDEEIRRIVQTLID